MSPWKHGRAWFLPLAIGILALGPPGWAEVVRPEVHRTADEGFFRIQVPADAQHATAAGLLARVDQGDAYLIQLDSGAPEGSSVPSQPRQLALLGRFLRPGPVRITLLARSPEGSPQSWKSLEFDLPDGIHAQPELRTQWAQLRRQALAGVDPAGEEPLGRTWNRWLAPDYGLEPVIPTRGTTDFRLPPDLYSVFTGAAAIQESLQLDPMPQQSAPRTSDVAMVPLASLAGPEVKSHPFATMLAGRQPRLPVLAGLVPADQYAVFFKDLSAEQELGDLVEAWGGDLLRQIQPGAQDYQVRGRLSRQLCVERSWMTRLFGNWIVDSMAFTGQDPFLKEGTAFTVLFSLRSRDRFLWHLERQYAKAVAAGARRSEFTLDSGQSGTSVLSEDRSVESHLLLLGDVAIVSNSRAALERVVAVAAKPADSLARSLDFQYVRTLFPQDSAAEDVFLYLSDAHIRHLVGPRWKIGEARRLRCAANLGLLAQAREWFMAEHKRAPDLDDPNTLRAFKAEILDCPDHGQYRFDAQGIACCSVHDRLGQLTPLLELAVDPVTAEEAQQYRDFVEVYQRYWRKYFDPIGMRIKLGNPLRIETCILPLIENSAYDSLVSMTGRRPGQLAEELALPQTVASVRAHLAPEWLDQLERPQTLVPQDWLGNDLSFNLCEGQVLFALGDLGQNLLSASGTPVAPFLVSYFLSAVNLPAYMTVRLKEPAMVEAALPQHFQRLRDAMSAKRRTDLSIAYYRMDDHQGSRIHVVTLNTLLKVRLYLAVVGDHLVISSRREVLCKLLETGSRAAPSQEASMALTIHRGAFQQLEESFQQGYQETQRSACAQNLPMVSIMMKLLGIPKDQLGPSAWPLAGFQPECPSGGAYEEDAATGAIRCTVHGNQDQPHQPPTGPDSSRTLQLVNSMGRMDVRLSFSETGLMSVLEIRKR